MKRPVPIDRSSPKEGEGRYLCAYMLLRQATPEIEHTSISKFRLHLLESEKCQEKLQHFNKIEIRKK